MSQKDLSRLDIITKVHEKRLTFAQAAEHLLLSSRQVKRLSKRLRNEGPKGLVSKKWGSTGNHRLSESVKINILNLLSMKDYEGFGPTLARESVLEALKIHVSVGTVRNLMIANGLWDPKKERPKKRVFQLRDRRERFGELIQVDGSIHEWFEERGPKCTLLVYIDDATSALQLLKFVPSESTESYCIATKDYVKEFGRPLAIYTDKHGVFRVNREMAINGAGRTQFGRAMEELEIKLICANSPQAKGRVERCNRVLQDRLIKAMRLEKISTLEEANAFTPSFIKEYNQKFAKQPVSKDNAHRPVLETQDLDRIFCLKETRKLSKNLSFQYDRKIYQIAKIHHGENLKNARVTILETFDGKVSVELRGKRLIAIPYEELPYNSEEVTSKELPTHSLKVNKQRINKADHPYRRGLKKIRFMVSTTN